MKLFIHIILLICFNAFSQNTHTVFLIDKSDSLIVKLRNSKSREVSGYKIINKDRVIIKHRRSSDLKGDDVEYETFDELYFSFNIKDDTIINKSFLDKLEIIKTRKEFLDINKNMDETVNEFIFIEPINCEKFILRKVTPIIFE